MCDLLMKYHSTFPQPVESSPELFQGKVMFANRVYPNKKCGLEV